MDANVVLKHNDRYYGGYVRNVYDKNELLKLIRNRSFKYIEDVLFEFQESDNGLLLVEIRNGAVITKEI